MAVSRRARILLCALALGGVTSVWADPVTDSWVSTYRRATTIEQRLQIMQSMVALDDPALVPVLADALRDQLDLREQRSRTDEVLWGSLVRLIVEKLARSGARETAPLLYRVVEQAQDPVVRAEALEALGAVGATDYADEIALLLRNLALYRGEHLEGEETLAAAAITALGALRQEVGYTAVFAALHTGISRRVTDLADEALAHMVPDPTTILESLVRDEADVGVKLLALRRGLSSDAPVASKARLAAAALEQGLTRVSNTPTETTSLSLLRSEAMTGIAKAAVADAAVPAASVRLAARVLDLDADVNELLLAVDTLRSIRGASASDALLEFLLRSNDRQAAGLVASPDRIRVVVAAIQALGALGARNALPELTRTQVIATWPGSLIAEAKAAVQAIASTRN